MRAMTAVVVLGLASVLVGCSAGGQAVVAQSASTLVAAYCKAPETARVLLRAKIAADTAPNRVRVECAADAL